MARAAVQLKIMPDGAEKDLGKIEEAVRETITKLGGDPKQSETEDVAFGLKALKIAFVIDEDKGTDEIETAIKELEDVGSVQVLMYDRLG